MPVTQPLQAPPCRPRHSAHARTVLRPPHACPPQPCCSSCLHNGPTAPAPCGVITPSVRLPSLPLPPPSAPTALQQPPLIPPVPMPVPVHLLPSRPHKPPPWERPLGYPRSPRRPVPCSLHTSPEQHLLLPQALPLPAPTHLVPCALNSATGPHTTLLLLPTRGTPCPQRPSPSIRASWLASPLVTDPSNLNSAVLRPLFPLPDT